MVDFNPENIVGTALQSGVDKAKAFVPGFNADSLNNIGQQLQESAGNALASEINELAGGLRAVISQANPFNKKKIMTFYLLDRNGVMVKPNDDSFQDGYLFNLLINPSNFTITLPPKTINPVRTMGGWVIQHWYPDIGTIQADGMIGNMLQRFNDDVKKTDNWANFKKLIRVFQNNGVPYTQNKGIRGQRDFNPIAVCTYDRTSYFGYFESFSFPEQEDKPFTRTYNFTFKYVDMVETEDIVELTRDKAFGFINKTLRDSKVGTLSSSINSFLPTKAPF